jgi:uncharacterized protein Smg (DUF494 family)
MPKKKIEKVHLTITVDVDTSEWLEDMSKELRMNKSQLINNLIEMGRDDAEIVRGLGLLGAVKVIRKLREKSAKSKGGPIGIEAGE